MPDTSASRRRRPSGGGRGWSLGRVGGVPVRIDGSWLLIAAVVAYLFYEQLAGLLDGYSLAVVVVASLVAALLFFASILAHELGHALVSLQRGMGVRGITLFALGGVTESTSEARSARDEFAVVGVGPLVSFVLAAVFGLLATAARPVDPIAGVLGYLGWANLVLAVFNVVPAYPLDGGRLLRSVLWGVTRRPHLATRWAARVGQLLAALLIVWSAWGLLAEGAGFGALWQVLIGTFLLRSATEAHQRAGVSERLERRTLEEVMGSVPPALPPDLPLDRAIDLVQQRPSLPWPVGEPVIGALRLADIDAVESALWPQVRAGDAAVPAERATVDVAVPLPDAVDRLREAPGNMLIVTRAGMPVGLLTVNLLGDL